MPTFGRFDVVRFVEEFCLKETCFLRVFLEFSLFVSLYIGFFHGFAMVFIGFCYGFHRFFMVFPDQKVNETAQMVCFTLSTPRCSSPVWCHVCVFFQLLLGMRTYQLTTILERAELPYQPRNSDLLVRAVKRCFHVFEREWLCS